MYRIYKIIKILKIHVINMKKCIMKIILSKNDESCKFYSNFVKIFKTISPSDINNQLSSFKVKSCTPIDSMILILL